MDEVSQSPFFDRAKSGGAVITHSLKVIATYPILLLPILACWGFYASGILYFKYFFGWENYSLREQLLIAFLIILGYVFLYSVAAFLLLEFLEQLERDTHFSILRAIFETTFKDLPKGLPVMIVWAFLDFVLFVIDFIIDVITHKFRRSEGSPEFNAENAAKTLAGYQDLSFANLSISAIQKGIRMIAFLIYPAIAWEDVSTGRAIKKAFAILRVHTVEFVSGYLTTWGAAAIIFLVPALLFYVTDKLDLHLPEAVWIATIIYCGIGWSFYLYLEQIFAGLLYLWNRKWERETLLAQKAGKRPLKLQDVKQPSFLDNIPDLI